MSNSTAILAATVSVIPALIVGGIVGSVSGLAAGAITGGVANACGVSDEKSMVAGGVVAGVTYYGIGGYTTFKIVQAVYNAFDE